MSPDKLTNYVERICYNILHHLNFDDRGKRRITYSVKRKKCYIYYTRGNQQLDDARVSYLTRDTIKSNDYITIIYMHWPRFVTYISLDVYE